MPVPSSNINITDIYDEANSGFPPSDLAASDLFKKLPQNVRVLQ